MTDALEGLGYHSDAQLVDVHVQKHYATYPEPPRTVVTIADIT